MLNDSRPVPVHPLLQAVLPLFLILQQNKLEIDPSQIWWAVAASISFAALLWIFTYLLSRDLNYAALITSLGVLLIHAMGRFYSGNVHGLIRGANVSAGLPGNPTLILGLAAAVFGLSLLALAEATALQKGDHSPAKRGWVFSGNRHPGHHRPARTVTSPAPPGWPR